MSKPKDFYIVESQLDDSQKQILSRTLERSLVVSGCAGSGKSLMALHKARRLEQEVGKSYCIIVFTKALCAFMNEGKRLLGLHNELIYYWEWKNLKYCPPVDYMIVDEIQDFSKEEIKEFEQAAKKGFIFFGDTAQSIFGPWKDTIPVEQIAYEANLQLMTLKYNYRLPIPVAKITEQYIGIGTSFHPGTYKSKENGLPRLIQYPDLDHQLDAIIRLIQAQHLTDVGILFRHGHQVKSAGDYFKEKGLNVEVQYMENKTDHKNRSTLHFSSFNPKVMTVHSAKGLQFHTVFIPTCNYPSDEENTKALYVAMTRSYAQLYMFYSGELSPILKGVPKQLYRDQESDPFTLL